MTSWTDRKSRRYITSTTGGRMTIPTASNDNVPRLADDFPDLAARREWVAARPRKTKRVLAWPTAERLARLSSPSAAEALMRYADLSTPARQLAANDNNEPDVDLPETDPEFRHEIRPGVKETLRAAAIGGMRCSVISAKVDTVVGRADRQRRIFPWRHNKATRQRKPARYWRRRGRGRDATQMASATPSA
jgi:hypothetical protein